MYFSRVDDVEEVFSYCRIVEPYARVHVDYVAKKIGLDTDLLGIYIVQYCIYDKHLHNW